MRAHVHLFLWRDPSDQSKGALWIYIHSDQVKKYGIASAKIDHSGPAPASGSFFVRISKNSRSKGRKWIFIMNDGNKFSCRIHSAASFTAVKAWSLTWMNIPANVKEDKSNRLMASGSKLAVWDEKYKVYFVKLLAFEITSTGMLYYKIGKAKIVPRRIHQFGPCVIEDVLDFECQREAFEAEAMIHKIFANHRIKSTEIFLLSESVVDEIRNVF